MKHGETKRWRKVWRGHYRLTVTLEKAVAPIDTRSRGERIEASLRWRFMAGHISTEEFEDRLGRAMRREATDGTW